MSEEEEDVEDDSNLVGDLQSVDESEEEMLALEEEKDQGQLEDLHEHLPTKSILKKRKPKVQITYEEDLEYEHEPNFAPKETAKLRKINDKQSGNVKRKAHFEF
mmetsp:Transcript_40697/g.29963  ORF Transcript_40697/g.29963 Transcript_40697/m.29963 type:complete len:104 (+) Transcript_40697:386-697(+)